MYIYLVFICFFQFGFGFNICDICHMKHSYYTVFCTWIYFSIKKNKKKQCQCSQINNIVEFEVPSTKPARGNNGSESKLHQFGIGNI